MFGTQIVYPTNRKSRRGVPYRKNEPSTTAKIKKDYCPFCNMPIAPKDPDRRTFLVHGKEVPFNFNKFKKYCRDFNWKIPPVFNAKHFDVESWLKEKAETTANLPENEIGNQWLAITNLAESIGLKTNFWKAVRE